MASVWGIPPLLREYILLYHKCLKCQAKSPVTGSFFGQKPILRCLGRIQATFQCLDLPSPGRNVGFGVYGRRSRTGMTGLILDESEVMLDVRVCSSMYA